MWTRLIVTFSFAVALLGVPTTPQRLIAQSKPVQIKLATSAPTGTPPFQALQGMAGDWRKATSGGVDLIPMSPKASEEQLVSRMLGGEFQAVMVSVTGLSRIDNSAKALEDMPFMFRSLEEVDYVRKKLTPDIQKRFLDKGYVVLFLGDIGWVRFFSRKPMIHPSDLQKMKIFVWAGDPAQETIMKAAGLHPVPLDTQFILSSLTGDLIDVVPTAPLIADSGQFVTVTRHMLDIKYAPLAGGAILKKSIWDSIPKASQDALLKAAYSAGELFVKTSRAENESMIDVMKKKAGLTVNPVTPEIESEWRDLGKAVYPSIRGPIVPADMFDRVTSLIEEYRSAKPAAVPVK